MARLRTSPDRLPRPSALPQPLWQISTQPPAIQLGDFGFQASAVDGWPAGGLRFRLRRPAHCKGS